MQRPISYHGNRVSIKNFRDDLNQRDELTGVYTLYTEYYDDDTTKFVDISLNGFNDITNNFDKAIYARYNTLEQIVETKELTLIYEGNILVDIDEYSINNDFFTSERLENIINTMVNNGRMEKILSNHESRLISAEDDIDNIKTGDALMLERLNISLAYFVETDESRSISQDDFGKILKCTNVENITITIPTDETLDIVGSQLCIMIDVLKYAAGNIVIAAADGVTIRKQYDGNTLTDLYGAVNLIRMGENEWMISGCLM